MLGSGRWYGLSSALGDRQQISPDGRGNGQPVHMTGCVEGRSLAGRAPTAAGTPDPTDFSRNGVGGRNLRGWGGWHAVDMRRRPGLPLAHERLRPLSLTRPMPKTPPNRWLARRRNAGPSDRRSAYAGNIRFLHSDWRSTGVSVSRNPKAETARQRFVVSRIRSIRLRSVEDALATGAYPHAWGTVPNAEARLIEQIRPGQVCASR
jgi:hypothetical protein